MPSPTPDPCDAAAGPALEICRGRTGAGGGGGATTPDTPLDSLDPLTSLAHSVAKAADWTARQLGDAIGDPSAGVDFTNAAFLRQYAVVFAATTVLVLVLWLAAVTKRAVRGAPMVVAMRDAVGLLWLAVLATAFTPLVLYVVVRATSAVTSALAAGLGTGQAGLFTSLGADLKAGHVSGGPLILLIVGAATILLCGLLWLLMVLRALALYVGALLGVVVYSGLVDQQWWHHVRKWAGFMGAVILVEPIMVITLGLASVLRSDHSNVVTGLAVTLITVGAAVTLIKKIPGWGDGINAARVAGRTAVGAARLPLRAVDAVAGVRQGIDTHSSRGGGGTSGSTSSTSKPSNAASGGIAAHSERKSRPPKQQGDKGK
ncbi:hypothetical protein [Streptomyces sp. NPDC050355]|uniref:hypothetical protein n=1 Tax=Streptomyces sp. NPDC050355 TaxID=3365609 RepID=UPI0037A08A8E